VSPSPQVPSLLAPPLPPGCPWSGFTPPNVDWCEEELCAWVTNPADTWSNLAYLAVGAWMIVRERKSRRPELRPFGPAAIAVGLFSGIYHASYTWMLQFFDFVGMFLFCFLVLTANALRLGWIRPRQQLVFFGVGTAAMSALVPLGFAAGFPIQALVFLLIFTMLGQEFALRGRNPGADYRPYTLALLLLTAAAVCSALDVTRVWCDPRNHWLQGHAAWHVLTAGALAALYRFYEGLPVPSAGPESPRPL